MKKIIIASLSASLLVAGCAPMNNEGGATVAGGVIGGLLGSQFGGGPAGRLAATAGGALVGAYIGGQIGRTMDRLDRLEMQRALETAPTGKVVVWTNPDTGYHYTVVPTRTYYHESQPCREYTTKAVIGGKTQQVYGKACRQADGSWRVVN